MEERASKFGSGAELPGPPDPRTLSRGPLSCVVDHAKAHQRICSNSAWPLARALSVHAVICSCKMDSRLPPVVSMQRGSVWTDE